MAQQASFIRRSSVGVGAATRWVRRRPDASPALLSVWREVDCRSLSRSVCIPDVQGRPSIFCLSCRTWTRWHLRVSPLVILGPKHCRMSESGCQGRASSASNRPCALKSVAGVYSAVADRTGGEMAATSDAWCHMTRTPHCCGGRPGRGPSGGSAKSTAFDRISK